MAAGKVRMTVYRFSEKESSVPSEEQAKRRAMIEEMARAVGLDITLYGDGVAAHFARIEARDSAYNCFTAITADRALREADSVDRALASGHDPGPLAGVPYAVKNLFDVAGLVTLAGSKINRDHPPAGSDATLVQRLAAA